MPQHHPTSLESMLRVSKTSGESRANQSVQSVLRRSVVKSNIRSWQIQAEPGTARYSQVQPDWARLSACCLLLSIAFHCCYPLPLDGAVIETFLMLLCMFWLNHSCFLRQFFCKINHCWRFSMFSIQFTTVSQCPAKVFSESKILIAPILNL